MPQSILFTRPDGRQVELLAWADYDLDALAAISEDDVSRAQRYWRAHLPRRYRLILDATSTVGTSNGLQLVR